VPRRSEYIRFKKKENVLKKIQTRVSEIFAFETPRSSTDTFDLCEQEEPIYVDITTYRPNINNKYWCCCCGRAPGDRSPARTSDEQTTSDPTDIHIQKVGEDTLPTDEIVNRSIAPKPERNGSKTKKRNKKKEMNNEMEVQHVDFDDREKRIQPTTSDDVRIGVPQKPVKHINTENQLSSFGKKTVARPDQTPNQDKNKEFRSVTSHAVLGKKFIGIKLPQAQSMPSLNEEETTDMPESKSEEMEKERDPSYIDMSETLKTAKSNN
jgi:hypothetical protein